MFVPRLTCYCLYCNYVSVYICKCMAAHGFCKCPARGEEHNAKREELHA